MMKVLRETVTGNGKTDIESCLENLKYEEPLITYVTYISEYRKEYKPFKNNSTEVSTKKTSKERQDG